MDRLVLMLTLILVAPTAATEKTPYLDRNTTMAAALFGEVGKPSPSLVAWHRT